MNYKHLITVAFILLIFSTLSGQDESETRTFRKTVAVTKESSLEVTNKYGTVHVTPWDKDSASIKVEVIAYASNQSKLRKMFDGIDINISETSYIVRAQTNFTQNINMLFESFKGMTSKLISYDSRVEIDYYISVPEYLDLTIENKYGDVYLENSYGKLRVSVSNGSFKANSIGEEASLNMAFCNATINSIKSGKIESNFSEITIGEAGDISINSISSKFDIRSGEKLQVESRRDKFYTGRIEDLEGNSYFTDFRIGTISNTIGLTTRYGGLNIDQIEKDFQSININSGYTDITLRFDPGISYDFDIRHLNSFVVLPGKNVESEQKAINEEKKEYMIFGTAGNIRGKGKVKIDATRGNIYLK